jgi:zinc transporter ZupT
VTRSALLYGLAAAAANVLGAVAVTMRATWSLRVLDALLSFAAGFLISVSLLDLLPDSIVYAGPVAPLIALGASTLLGVVLTDQLPLLRHYGLAVSAGVTLYVAASNLVPELQDRPGARIPLSFVAGCGLYLAARSVALA